MDIHELINLLAHGTLDSLYMIIICTVVSYIIGLPIGVSLIAHSNSTGRNKAAGHIQ